MSKKITNVFKEIVDFDNLYKSYKKALKGKNRYNKDNIKLQKSLIYTFIRTLLKKYNYIYKSYNDKIKLRLGYKENRYKIHKEDI